MREYRPVHDFSRSPVAYDYLQDKSLFHCIMGPVGSGKTFASCLKPLLLSGTQVPNDGYRFTRGIVVRNTMPELKSTTIDSWQRMYPEEHAGPVIMASPARHTLRREPQGDQPGINMEVLFVALDKPKDVKKLLSLEASWIYFNEIREIPRAIVNRAIDRVGRYMIEKRPTSWSGVFGDTNPPDDRHYLFEWDKTTRPHGYHFLHQPPAVIEVDRVNGKIKSKEADWFPGRLYDQPVIQAADREWIVNPDAENLKNLAAAAPDVDVLGPDGYYGRLLPGKQVEEIQCYYQGKYVFVSAGKPVIPEYSDARQAVEGLKVLDSEPLQVGIDIGGGTLQPSAVIFQRHPRGIWLVHAELVCFDLGADKFGQLLSGLLASKFPKHWGRHGGVKVAWADPACEKRDELFEVAVSDHLRAEWGIPVQAAPSQDPRIRMNGIRAPCSRLVDGKPGLLINSDCVMLRRGLMGAWCYRKMQVVGVDMWKEVPDKNEYSHVCDALGYGLTGGGELNMYIGRGTPEERAVHNRQLSQGHIIAQIGAGDMDI